MKNLLENRESAYVGGIFPSREPVPVLPYFSLTKSNRITEVRRVQDVPRDLSRPNQALLSLPRRGIS